LQHISEIEFGVIYCLQVTLRSFVNIWQKSMTYWWRMLAVWTMSDQHSRCRSIHLEFWPCCK